MSPLKVLISGGGIAGPALAFWLSKAGHDVTVIERFPDLRASGQQIDLRGQGVQVMKMMGIEEAVRAKVVDESGVEFVDSSGKRKAFFLANKSGKGQQSFTSEFEIMRGDLCRILYDVTKDKTKYRFGLKVTAFEQDSQAVRVQFSDGTEGQYDLLVGADGQGSRTRRMMLDTEAPDPFQSLGVYGAYFTIPQLPGDESIAKVCHAPDKRIIATRRDNPKTLQAYLFVQKESEELKEASKMDVSEQKELCADIFHNMGWQGDRIINAMLHEPTADDFYFQVVGQVKMDKWSRGRVVLLGDAAHCPSPITGMGTSSSLVGAYVLAGEITRHCAPGAEGVSEGDGGIAAALEAYESRFRPFIEKVQKLPPGVPGIVYPATEWGISILHLVVGLLSTVRIDKLAAYFTSDNVSGWDLPDYPQLQ